MMDMAARAHRLLGCKGASRSDFRWDDEQGEAGIYLLEVNTQPGMTPLSLVPEQAKLKGISYGELVERLIEEALAMSAAHVRRGGAGARQARKKPSKVAVPKKIAKRLPVDQARANKVAGLVFGAFMLAIGAGRAGRARHSGEGRARGRRRGRPGRLHGQRLSDRRHQPHEPRAVDGVVTDELQRAADEAGTRQGAAGAGRRRRDPRAAAQVRLGQGRARLAPPARHAGHRHRRAHARRACGRARASWR